MNRNIKPKFLVRIGLFPFVLLCVVGSICGGFAGLLIAALAAPSSYSGIIIMTGLILPVLALVVYRQTAKADSTAIGASTPWPKNVFLFPSGIRSEKQKRQDFLIAMSGVVLGLVVSSVFFLLSFAMFAWIFRQGNVPTTGFGRVFLARWAKVSMLVVLPIAFLATIAMQLVAKTTAELPNCNSSVATNALKQAVEDSPYSGMRIKIFSTKDVKECGIREDDKLELLLRACSATLYTNAGELPAHFHIRWIDKKKGEWFLETQSCPWRFGIDGWKEKVTERTPSK